MIAFPLVIYSLCSEHAFAFGPQSNSSIESYRAEARVLMKRTDCGRCHIPPGNNKALKVFDLDRENWTSTMTIRQIGQIKWRIEWTNEDIKNGRTSKYFLSQADIEMLQGYVDREIANRESKHAKPNRLNLFGH